MNDLKKIILVAVIAGLTSGIVTVLGFGLVGGNQPVQTTVKEILGVQGTNFPNGLQTDYVTYPNVSNNTVGLLSNDTTRRCTIASGSDNCEIINYSSVDWIVRPRLWATGATTNTKASFFVATSTFAFAGSWWEGVATTSLAHAPISFAIATTSAPFGNLNHFGTSTQGGTLNAYQDGLFLVRNGDRAICAVTRRTHRGGTGAGGQGFYEVTTSTNFVYRGNCLFEIIATSTPDTTPER